MHFQSNLISGAIIVTFLCCVTTSSIDPKNRSFSIDFENNCFIKDGEPFRYVSGSMHYFRTLADQWDDILYKMKLGGLNAVQLYVEWASHQPSEDKYKFTENLNMLKLLNLAKKHDLLVILRPGPYVDAERDMGGLPSWLLWKYPNIKLRSMDADFTFEVSKWFGVLLPMIYPYLYESGGPIIMIQVENEYGSYSCDLNYKIYLRDLIKSFVGQNVVLFTTDFAEEDKLRCGSVPGVYPTVDFGAESNELVHQHFSAQRSAAPKGPLVNSEFYTGWFDRWGQPHQTVSAADISVTLDTMLALGANVNIYVFHGGTSFGFTSGATTDNVTGPGGFQPVVTSYDFGAPLNEAGDPTDKYFAIKAIIAKYRNVSAKNPVVSPKGNYGKVKLTPLVSILDEAILNMFAMNPVNSLSLLSFESLFVGSGFVLYETVLDFSVSDPAILTMPNLRDRAYVLIGKELTGIASRTESIYSLPILINKGEKLQILVESLGRPSFAEFLGESKGIGLDVRLGTRLLLNWTMYQLGELNTRTFQKFSYKKYSRFVAANKADDFATLRSSAMTFTSTFTVGNKTNPNPLATFVRFEGWRKGMIWINNFNLGRYWPVVGPQQTLYLPSSLLNPYPGKNYLLLLELEKVPEACAAYSKDGCFIEFTDKHVINGTTAF